MKKLAGAVLVACLACAPQEERQERKERQDPPAPQSFPEPTAGEIAVTVAPAFVRIDPGSTARLTISVDRSSGFDAAVTISVPSPPPGVTVEPVTVPGGMTQGELVVVAAADALLQPADRVWIEAEGGLPRQTMEVSIRVGVYAPDDLGDGHAWIGDAWIKDVARSQDGILVAGMSVLQAGSDRRIGAVVTRLDLDARPDPTWGEGGMVTLEFGTGINARATAVHELPDGRVLLAGGVTIGRYPDWSFRDFLVRLDSAGALDPSFADDGWLWIERSEHADDTLFGVDSAGRILFNPGRRLSRLMPDGALDVTYGNGGTSRVLNVYGFLEVVDDSVVALSGGLIRIAPDGTEVWRKNGTYASDVAVEDGLLYAIGTNFTYSAEGDPGPSYAVVRAFQLEDGSPVGELGGHGVAEMPFVGEGHRILPREGGILTAGIVKPDDWDDGDENIYFARLHPDGTFAEEPAFRDLDYYDGVIELLETDGGVIAACRSHGDGPSSQYLLRLGE